MLNEFKVGWVLDVFGQFAPWFSISLSPILFQPESEIETRNSVRGELGGRTKQGRPMESGGLLLTTGSHQAATGRRCRPNQFFAIFKSDWLKEIQYISCLFESDLTSHIGFCRITGEANV